MDYAAVTMAVHRFPLACNRDKVLARLTGKVTKAVQMYMLIPLKDPCLLDPRLRLAAFIFLNVLFLFSFLRSELVPELN
jgi:hypothetical protein